MGYIANISKISQSISLFSYLQLYKLHLFAVLTIFQIHYYGNLRIIGLMICIDLFVVFSMEGGECRYVSD